MIWHDFMFSDGQYPLYDTFEKSVRTEVTQQVKRLRNNCCIVIWAGNNEDYQVASQFNLTWDPDDHSGDYRNTDFRKYISLNAKIIADAVFSCSDTVRKDLSRSRQSKLKSRVSPWLPVESP